MQNHQNNTTGISQLIHANVFLVRTRSVEMLHKSAVFISLFDTCTFHGHPLTSTYWWIREYWKGRDLWVTLSFYVIVFSVSGWLIQRRKGDGFPWLFMFLGTPSPSLLPKQLLVQSRCNTLTFVFISEDVAWNPRRGKCKGGQLWTENLSLVTLV